MNTLKQAWELTKQIPTFVAEGLERWVLSFHRPVMVADGYKIRMEDWENDPELRAAAQTYVEEPSPRCSLDGEAWPCRRVREAA